MKKTVWSVVAVAVVAAVAAADVPVGRCPAVEGGRPFGRTRAVGASGAVAYFSSGALLQAVELRGSGPSGVLAEVGFPDLVVAIVPDGDRLVVGDLLGVSVVHVADPIRPVVRGRHDTVGLVRDVDVEGDVAVVADPGFGLRVVDLSDPWHPTEVGALATGGQPFAVAVRGGTAWLADFDGGLVAIDVSRPSDPRLVSAFLPEGALYAVDVAIEGDVAAVAVWDEGLEGSLRLVDVSAPSAPVELGRYELVETPTAVEAAGSVVFIAESTLGPVHVVDVSDPAAPTELSQLWLASPSDVVDLAAAGGRLLVADPTSGLVVVDVSVPTSPVRIGEIGTPGLIRSVDVDGDRVVTGGHGLRVLEIAPWGTPVEVGAWERDDVDPLELPRVDPVAVAGDVAYLGWSSSELVVVDLTVPEVPVEIASLPGLTVRGVVARGRWVMTSGDAFAVVDAAAPSNPVVVARIDQPGGTDLALADDAAFVTFDNAGFSGLDVIDVANPASPRLQARLLLPCAPNAVAVAGGRAFVGCALGGLLAVDVSDPSAPEVVARDQSIERIRDLAVSGGCLHVLEQEVGLGASVLRTLDVSDPTRPATVRVMAYAAYDLAPAGARLAAAAGELGVWLLDPVSCACAAAREPAPAR